MHKIYKHTWNFVNAIVMLSIFSITAEGNIRQSTDSISASKQSSLMIQLEMENGGMLPSNEVIKEKFQDIYYNAINLRVGWQTKPGTDPYHARYNYPVYGFGLYASSFHKEEIGTPNALYGFVSIPIAPHALPKWDFSYRIALGLASNFHPYNREKNPTNILLGSQRNVFIDLGFQANYILSNRFQLGAGFAFHHFSNGSIRQPNKGINLIPFTLSATYRPGGLHRVQQSREQIKNLHFEENSQVHIHYAAGIKEFEPNDDKQYFKSTMGAYWSHSVGPKWRLGAGADLFYSHSGKDIAIAGDQAGELSALLSGGPAFYIDHVLTRALYISGNVGWYAHRNAFNGETKPVFLRIGVRYNVFHNTYAGVSIKAHMGKADFIEWTLGYTLKKSR